MWYRACKQCNKKVTEAIGSGYWCEGCQKNDDECNLRSTIIHSSPIIPLKEKPNLGVYKDQQNQEETCKRNSRDADRISRNIPRTFQAQQRIPMVVGPIVQYENGSSMKDAYDPRAYIRTAVLPPQPIPSPYHHVRRTNVTKQERSTTDPGRDLPQSRQQIPQCSMMAKLAPEVAIDIESSFYLSRAGVTKPDKGIDRIAVDAHMIQAKSQFGAAAAAPAHRKVGTVQFGMSRMY